MAKTAKKKLEQAKNMMVYLFGDKHVVSPKKSNPPREVLDAGGKITISILRAHTRKNAVATALIWAGSMLAVGGVLGAMEMDPIDMPAKIRETGVPIVPLAMMLGMGAAAVGVGRNANWTLAQMNAGAHMVMSNLGLEERHYVMVFGLVANYMTDAEYKKLFNIIEQWHDSKVPFSFKANDKRAEKYVSQITPLLAAVLDRTPGLRQTLEYITTEKDNKAVNAKFDQEAFAATAFKKGLEGLDR